MLGSELKMSHCEKNCISLFLTEDCNLNCKYCYCKGDRKKSKSMDLDFIKSAIDDFYNQNNRLYLRFFGNGEPTLEMEVIKKATNYARVKDSNSVIEIQTNGFFNESVCTWLGDNMNIIWISCDGPASIQDFYRPSASGEGTSTVVEKNIKYLAHKNNLQLGVRPTIGNKNIDRQNEMIDYFYSLGVKYIYSDLMFATSDNVYFEENISRMAYAEKFLAAKKYADTKGIFYGSFFTMNFDSPSNISCRSCIPAPHLTLDGYVSCCDMVYSNNKYTEFIYGSFNFETKKIEYNQDKINYIRTRTVENLPECNDCDVKYYCAGGCLGEAIYEKGSIFKVKTENCEVIRFLAKELGVNTGKFPISHP